MERNEGVDSLRQLLGMFIVFLCFFDVKVYKSTNNNIHHYLHVQTLSICQLINSYE